jgi:hypothetical protein
MNANDFREIALEMPGATESAHQDHPDFRVRGKVFATLGYPTKDWGMVKLPLRDQEEFVFAYPEVFVPANGAWGRQGATTVLLKSVKKATLQKAIYAAWRAATPKNPRTAGRR